MDDPLENKFELPPDPLDNFKLPPELYRHLSKKGRKQVIDKVFNLDQRLLEREPKMEEGYQYGHHLWELFDVIAEDLQGDPLFLDFLDGLIPDAISLIRKDVRWYPHNFEHDLRPYYLKAPMIKWRRIALAAKESSLSKQKPSRIEKIALHPAMIEQLKKRPENRAELAAALEIDAKTLKHVLDRGEVGRNKAIQIVAKIESLPVSQEKTLNVEAIRRALATK